MKQLQQLSAALVLTLVMSAAAIADGTIHTGTPPPPPPPPPMIKSESAAPAAPEAVTGEEPSIFEAATAAALNMLRDMLTLF